MDIICSDSRSDHQDRDIVLLFFRRKEHGGSRARRPLYLSIRSRVRGLRHRLQAHSPRCCRHFTWGPEAHLIRFLRLLLKTLKRIVKKASIEKLNFYCLIERFSKRVTKTLTLRKINDFFLSNKPPKQHFTWYLYILRVARFPEGHKIFTIPFYGWEPLV